MEDINEEFRASSVFLVLTNVNADFLVGNTRILLAWALGSCVVMHENSSLAMPEIEHGVNALLGKTPDELAGAYRLQWTMRRSEDESGRGGSERSRPIIDRMWWFRKCLISFRTWWTDPVRPLPCG